MLDRLVSEVNARTRKLEVDKQSIGKKLTQADVRRNVFLNKIIDENPDIICFQEQIHKDLSQADQQMFNEFLKNPPQKMGEYETYYEREESQKEAAVMVKKSVILRGTKPKRVYFKDEDKKTFSEIQARMVLVKVALAESQSTIHIASWHGPHKSSNEEKLEDANKVMQIVIGKVGSSPYIIGPQKDFPKNTNYNSIADKSNDIDYFVYGGRGCSMKDEDVKKSNYKNPNTAKAFLDHIPTVGKLRKE